MGQSSDYLGVPIKTKGKILGVISVLGKTNQRFNMEEVALLTSVADHIGVAVDNAHLRRQAERAAVLEERGRLARDLHDSVTQLLYGLTLFAKTAWIFIERGNLEGVKHNILRIRETADQALKEMRLLVHELRPLDLKQEGLVEVLRRRLNAVEGRANVKARLLADESLQLPALVEEGLYRIAQEALNNALKHAAAKSVTVHLRSQDEHVELEVVDDGIGFDIENVRNAGGIGLVSMHERAAALNGSFVLNSTEGEGTQIKVTVKLE